MAHSHYEPHFYGPVQGVVIGDNNTVTLIYQSGETATIPFLALPMPPHALVGRDGLLQAIKEQLLTSQSPTSYALIGLPGVGKTALALALTHDPDVIQHFQDGILWAGLGCDADILAHLSVWATALNISLPEIANKPTLAARAEAIHLAIGMKRLLLVVDDAWQVEAALAFRLGGPNCAYLLTSRFPEVALRFAGQETRRVNELSEQDALTLLSHLAPEVVQAEPSTALELVRSVGQLPLGLKLMGNYLRLESYNGQQRRLSNALQTLRQAEKRLALSEPQPLLSPHPSLPFGTPVSLKAVLEVSAQALPDRVRQALWSLAAFRSKPNTFSEDAALHVCESSTETLDKLVDAGLLEGGGPNRYCVHQTITDYARESNQEPAIFHRLVGYYVRLASTHKEDYPTLEEERENVATALEIAGEQGLSEALVQGILMVYPFLESRGLYDQAERYLQQAEQAVKHPGGEKARAEILLFLGRVAQRSLRYDRAETYCQEALMLARTLGEPLLASGSLTELGIITTDRMEFIRAEAYFQEALALSHGLENEVQTALILVNLGRVIYIQEKFQAAEEYLLQARDLAQRLNLRERLVGSLTLLGVLYYAQGNPQQAEECSEEALRLAQRIGNRERISALLTNLGQWALKRGDFLRAESYLQEGLALARQLGHCLRSSHLLMDLGILRGHQSDMAQATSLLEESLELAQQSGSLQLVAYIHLRWGDLSSHYRQWEQARLHFAATIALAAEPGVLQTDLALAHWGLAKIAAEHNDLGGALLQARKGAELLEAIGHHQAAEIRDWVENVGNLG